MPPRWPGTNTKKGLIDLVIAIVAGVTYLNFNSTTVNFLQWSFAIPYPLYLVLIVVLIWASINVVNCTDGVDGLSASLAVVSIGTFLLAYGEELGGLQHRRHRLHRRTAGLPVDECQALHPADG